MSKERELLMKICKFLDSDVENDYGFSSDIRSLLTQPNEERLSMPQRLEEYKKGYARAEQHLKREPLSDKDINEERFQIPIGIWHFKSFEAGIKFAEKAHGIGGEE